jgi:hypothetical protein
MKQRHDFKDEWEAYLYIIRNLDRISEDLHRLLLLTQTKPRYYSIKEVSIVMHLSVRQVWRLAQKHVLHPRHIKKLRKTLFLRDEVEKLAELTNGQGAKNVTGDE